MKNEILDKIKKSIITTLNNEYGYCGLADSEDMAMINSSDSEGNDIVINIKIKNNK